MPNIGIKLHLLLAIYIQQFTKITKKNQYIQGIKPFLFTLLNFFL